MGANSKQGWYLFLFLLGFTFLPAGLVYMGMLVALAGLVMLVVSCAGFYSIKHLEHEVPAGTARAPQVIGDPARVRAS